MCRHESNVEQTLVDGLKQARNSVYAEPGTVRRAVPRLRGEQKTRVPHAAATT
jgi:hypothetical protein